MEQLIFTNWKNKHDTFSAKTLCFFIYVFFFRRGGRLNTGSAVLFTQQTTNIMFNEQKLTEELL